MPAQTERDGLDESKEGESKLPGLEENPLARHREEDRLREEDLAEGLVVDTSCRSAHESRWIGGDAG